MYFTAIFHNKISRLLNALHLLTLMWKTDDDGGDDDDDADCDVRFIDISDHHHHHHHYQLVGGASVRLYSAVKSVRYASVRAPEIHAVEDIRSASRTTTASAGVSFVQVCNAYA